MAKVFVSYSRKDIEFAKRLTAELTKSDLDFWIDWEGIPPTVDWWKEIEKGIEEADVFLFLISPDSAKSKVCGQEIEVAVKNGKRIIPIVVCDIVWEDTPKHLGHLNYIFIRESDDFDAAVKKLMIAIQTDYEWVATHRRLQVKALEWQRNNKENSFLLRGKDLHDAELQLATNSSKEPHPTDLQREYVFTSRKATDRQRRIMTGIAMAGIVALATLAVFGFVKAGQATSNEKKAVDNASTAQAASTLAFNNAETAQANEKLADERAKIARAGELAAQSVSQRDKQFDLSLLLSIEAFLTADTPQVRSVLIDNTQANAQMLQYLATSGVSSVAFTPDGKTLASGSYDSTIILWDVETRQPIGQPLIGHTSYVLSVAFSPDGKTLASASDDSTIIVWDVETHLPIGQPLMGHTIQINSVAFSPDGKTLASGSYDSTIILWDVETRQPIGQPLIGHTSEVNSVAFSPDGKTLASAGGGSTIILWDVETHQPSGQLLTGRTDSVFSISFSPDGKTLASASDDRTIILWDVETRQPIGQPLTGHTDSVFSVAFSPDGKTLASGSLDSTIVLWNVSPQYWIEQSCQRAGRNYTRAEWERYFPNGAYGKTCEQWPLEP